MAKIKFGEKKTKREDGFIETTMVAYADVTKIAKNIFGDVKKSYLILDAYYKGEPIEDWKKNIKEQYSSIKDSDMGLEVDAKTLYVEFVNGKVASFTTSEWGSVHSCKSMIEIA